MLNRGLLGRGMSEQCEMIFQQTITNSDMAMTMGIFHLTRASPTGSSALFIVFLDEE